MIAGDAGIVDKDVEASGIRQHLRDDRFRVVVVGNIAADRDGFSTIALDLLDDFSGGRFAAKVVNGDECAVRCEPAANCAPDPTRSTGDQSGSA
ncbi:hypothetical protein Ntsu_41430 [Nocardia sp. IFM 10818]